MKYSYGISGDGTGLTYGIWRCDSKLLFFKHAKLIQSDIKSFREAQKIGRK